LGSVAEAPAESRAGFGGREQAASAIRKIAAQTPMPRSRRVSMASRRLLHPAIRLSRRRIQVPVIGPFQNSVLVLHLAHLRFGKTDEFQFVDEGGLHVFRILKVPPFLLVVKRLVGIRLRLLRVRLGLFRRVGIGVYRLQIGFGLVPGGAILPTALGGYTLEIGSVLDLHRELQVKSLAN